VKGMRPAELATLKRMLQRGLNAPFTTSAGRLFDVVAALAGLRQQTHFEGQAAMELEFALEGVTTDEAYEFRISDFGFRNDTRADATRKSAIRNPQSAIKLDWQTLVEALLADVKSGVSAGRISAKFHHALAEAIVTVAKRIGQPRVALSGAVSESLFDRARRARLRAEGFRHTGISACLRMTVEFPSANRCGNARGKVGFRTMCLAIPGKIVSVSGEDPLERTGKIDFGGVLKDASLAYVPEAKIGDYVIVHVGFALSRLDEQEARKVFEYLKQMEELEELGRPDAGPAPADDKPRG